MLSYMKVICNNTELFIPMNFFKSFDNALDRFMNHNDLFNDFTKVEISF